MALAEPRPAAVTQHGTACHSWPIPSSSCAGRSRRLSHSDHVQADDESIRCEVTASSPSLAVSQPLPGGSPPESRGTTLGFWGPGAPISAGSNLRRFPFRNEHHAGMVAVTLRQPNLHWARRDSEGPPRRSLVATGGGLLRGRRLDRRGLWDFGCIPQTCRACRV